MSATKAQINFAAISWNSVNFTRVTSLGISQGGKLIKFKGDTDIYSTIIANVDNEPSVTITTADIGTVMGCVPGVSATFTATMNDAKTASGGSIVWTMINAVFENADSTAQHAQFGSVNASWQAYSSDGTTNPLSFARV